MPPVATAHLDLTEFFDNIVGDDEAVADLRTWVQTVAGNIVDDPNVQEAWTGGDDDTFDRAFTAELFAAIEGAIETRTLPSWHLLLVDRVVTGMVDAARVTAVAWMAATFTYADAT